MLKLDGIARRFRPLVAVDRVDLLVPDGQFLAIIGSSGAGKSTMLRLINRLVEPSAGSISYGGRDVTALKGPALRSWRAECAMIFQQFNLVDRLDVLTNVLTGRVSRHGLLSSLIKRFDDTERTLAIRALDRLGMAEPALQRVATLSGGQQQRVAIARALLQEPRIILADEPIASLDPANAQRVMDALRIINREDGITVLVNLHDLATARAYADRIVGLAAGRIVFDGRPSDLDAATIRQIYGTEDPDAVATETPRAAPVPELLPA
jgi:phosphonate transport system ATP-binding protein